MDKGNDAILVTGATGQQGGAVARELLDHGHRVYAMTRSPDSDAAKALADAGATVVQGDLNDADSLEKALEGMWGVFAVQNTWEAGVEGEEEQGKRLARLAKEAGVQHYVYTSVGAADENTGIPHFDNKYRVEETIRSLDLPSWTILRPVFFMENLTSPWFKPAIDEGNLAIGIEGDTKLQMIAVQDIGRYGHLAFDKHEELNGKAIDIAGDELTPVEAAEILSREADREITHYQVPIEEVREFSADFAAMLEWFDEKGYSVDIEANREAYGIQPTSFNRWAQSVDWRVTADVS